MFFAEEHEHLDVFAVDLHETGPSGGDVHWRGAATGESRASFEGLIQIDPGAQQTHTYLQIHSMMLSAEGQASTRSPRCSSPPTTSPPPTAAPSASSTRRRSSTCRRAASTAPTAVRVIVEGFFEPLIAELDDEPLERAVRERIGAKLAAARDDIERYAAEHGDG